MSQRIITSRYRKSGSARRRNYTKYIAIRETVELHEQRNNRLHTAKTPEQNALLQG